MSTHSQMISPHYLILHSEHDGDLQKPWIVYRCWHDSDRQDELFRGERASAVAYLAEHWDDDLDKLSPVSPPSAAWVENRNGYFQLDAGELQLSITDQSYRGCGWVWHASVNGINGGDTIDQRGGHATADDAKRACEEWVREFCRKALAAISTPPTRGGPTEQFPDAPYCKPDQSCCDFCCGN